MLSVKWTETFIGQLGSMSPRFVGVVGPKHSGGNTAILTYDFVHRRHIEMFGFYYPRYYTPSGLFTHFELLSDLKMHSVMEFSKPTIRIIINFTIFSMQRVHELVGRRLDHEGVQCDVSHGQDE
jgi:hypothetical protein